MSNKFFPLQIQAYERIILFLERIDPSNMLIRTHKSGMTIESLHMALLKIIREEYTHNMSQQVFIDPNSWQILLNANCQMNKKVLIFEQVLYVFLIIYITR